MYNNCLTIAGGFHTKHMAVKVDFLYNFSSSALWHLKIYTSVYICCIDLNWNCSWFGNLVESLNSEYPRNVWGSYFCIMVWPVTTNSGKVNKRCSMLKCMKKVTKQLQRGESLTERREGVPQSAFPFLFSRFSHFPPSPVKQSIAKILH